MPNFRIDTLYSEAINFQYGLVTPENMAGDTHRIMGDGRSSCHLVQEHLALRFANLSIDALETRAGIKTKTREVIRVNGRKENYVVRTITSQGLLLMPSKNIGFGRHFNQQDFNDLLEQIAGYIIVDIRHGTCLKYSAVAKDRIPNMCRLDGRDAEYYLGFGKRNTTI